MTARRSIRAAVCLLAVAAGAAGCGGGGGAATSVATTVASRPAPPKSDFPDPAGMTLAEVVKSADSHAELEISPGAVAFHRGVNRYPFGVFRLNHRQVPDAEVALYISRVPAAKPRSPQTSEEGGKHSKGALARARTEALERPAAGPFPAAVESLATKPAFRSRTTVEDPTAATAVYVSRLPLPSDGEWRVAALVRHDGELSATLLPSVVAGRFERLPAVGQKAPLIHTPTPADTGGDLASITTRVPPDTQNGVDYAKVLGEDPIILLFATPQFCQSRVCGPVVDVAEQVKREYGDRADFIHMEIYKDNDPSKGVRPQVRAFRLPSEPWLFAIDRRGVIRAEIEGAFGVERLTRAVKEAIGE